MNVRLKLFVLPAIFAMAVGSLFAETLPAMVVQVIMTDDAEAYAEKIVKANAIIKAKAGHERLRRVWVGDLAGENSNAVFVVSQFPSAASAAQLQEKLQSDVEGKAFMAELKPMRKLGPAFLYKAVRLDGMYDGGAVFNTAISCTDEDAYAKSLDGLKAIFAANGFKDAKVNLWRLAAGRSDSTHLVVISLASQSRIGELLDSISDQALLKDWNVGAAKIRTTVRNGTYHEITK